MTRASPWQGTGEVACPKPLQRGDSTQLWGTLTLPRTAAAPTPLCRTLPPAQSCKLTRRGHVPQLGLAMARGARLGRVLLGASLVVNTAPARGGSVPRSSSKPCLGQGGQVTSQAVGSAERSQLTPSFPHTTGERRARAGAWLGGEGRSASHGLCIPRKPMERQRRWAGVRAGREVGLGVFLGGSKAVSLVPRQPAQPPRCCGRAPAV